MKSKAFIFERVRLPEMRKRMISAT
jgi:hypothetical protein